MKESSTFKTTSEILRRIKQYLAVERWIQNTSMAMASFSKMSVKV
jgi:hypothetical protein